MSHLPANWLPPEPPPRRTRSSILPALITVSCAFLLLGGSLFGALATCSLSKQTPWFSFFAGLSIFLFVSLIVSIVWLLVAVLFAFFRRSREDYDRSSL
jgi:hypothetical protein